MDIGPLLLFEMPVFLRLEAGPPFAIRDTGPAARKPHGDIDASMLGEMTVPAIQ